VFSEFRIDGKKCIAQSMDALCMTYAGLPFDTAPHGSRDAIGYQPCQGWPRARTINFSPDDTPMASAAFWFERALGARSVAKDTTRTTFRNPDPTLPKPLARHSE
jgi:hypothetical protein